jgi:hypothetical protein
VQSALQPEEGTRAGEPEIREVISAVRVYQDVVGLDVAVHDAQGMGGREGSEHLGAKARHLLRLYLPRKQKPPIQVATGEVLHGQVDHSGGGVDAELVRARHVRVIEEPADGNLAPEGFGDGLGLPQVPVQHFQGNPGIEDAVVGEVDVGDRSPAEESLQRVPVSDERACLHLAASGSRYNGRVELVHGAPSPPSTAISFLDRGCTLYRIAYQGCRGKPGLDGVLGSPDVQDLISVGRYFRLQGSRPLPIVGYSYSGHIGMLAASTNQEALPFIA